MRERGIDAYIVNGSDPHGSEYPPLRWKTRGWLTGFTGSAGTVVVTQDKAGLWTDSRYFLQAEKEIVNTGIALFKTGLPGVPSCASWLKSCLSDSGVVSSDALSTTLEERESLQRELSGTGISYLPGEDLLNRVWEDRPPLPEAEVFQLDSRYCGKGREEKLKEIRKVMRDEKAAWYLVSSLSDIAWVLNLRGNDIPYNPLFLAYLLIGRETAVLFIGSGKISPVLQDILKSEGIGIQPYHTLGVYVERLTPQSILFSPLTTSVGVASLFSKDWQITIKPDCTETMKAVKNSVELRGTRNAMKKDGAALVRFMKWLEEKWPVPGLDEIVVSEKLIELRSMQDGFMGPSFETIAGFADHGAIVHYAAKPEGVYALDRPGYLLLDSGGQYLDGTTDITRVIPVGVSGDEKVDPSIRRDYTLVLKGHIDLAEIQFPEGTTGIQLDILARRSLWMEGKNYLHGTGHGVGFFLTVHEGPESISPRQPSAVLKPGMIVSDEPGLYREGRYGIRIENLMAVTTAEKTDFGQFYAFETLTLCPLESSLIDTELLTAAQRGWIDTYHEKVYTLLAPLLTKEERLWLKRKTAALQ